MKVPNADRAIVTRDKLCDYLLNVEHRKRGCWCLWAIGSKTGSGLGSDLRSQHLAAEVDTVANSDYGTRYEVAAALCGPAGWSRMFRSVWQVDAGADVTRLITMYPETL